MPVCMQTGYLERRLFHLTVASVYVWKDAHRIIMGSLFASRRPQLLAREQRTVRAAVRSRREKAHVDESCYGESVDSGQRYRSARSSGNAHVTEAGVAGARGGGAPGRRDWKDDGKQPG